MQTRFKSVADLMHQEIYSQDSILSEDLSNQSTLSVVWEWDSAPTLSFHNSFSISNNDLFFCHCLSHLEQCGICRHKTALETPTQ